MKQPIALLTILLILSACHTGEITMGTHQIRVIPTGLYTYSSSSISGSEETYIFKTGNTRIKIENDNLFVNDKDFGKVQTNSKILVEQGKVFISGQEKLPL